MTEPRQGWEPAETLTPLSVSNRSGLDSLRYRVGTHSAFLASMKAALSRRGFPLLGRLTSDTSDDPAIALLNAWATVADVLTFYQERIANEGYIRTAREDRSLVELARLVGYVSSPGVAASVYLAYTVENNVSSQPDQGRALSSKKESPVTIPVGARVQTIPGPGELPQSFETAEELEARASWNKLKPRLTRPQRITPENAETLETLYFDGIATGLKANDLLLFVFPNPAKQYYRHIAVVYDPETDKKRTKVALQPISQLRAVEKAVDPFILKPPEKGKQETQGEKTRREILESLKQQMIANVPPGERLARISKKTVSLERFVKGTRGGETRDWLTNLVATLNERTKKDQGGDLTTQEGASRPLSLDRQRADGPVSELAYDVVAKSPLDMDTALSDRLPGASLEETNPVTVYAFRVKASLFGHSAPLEPKELNDKTKVMKFGEWQVGDEDKTRNTLYLDASYDKIAPNSWVLLEYSPHERVLVTKATAVDAGISRAAYGISGKTTRLVLPPKTPDGNDSPWFQGSDGFDVIRQTVVYVQSEELPLAAEPYLAAIGGENSERIELDGYVEGLEPGRWLIVTGEEEDISQTPDEIGLEEAQAKELRGGVTIKGMRRSELVRLAAVHHGWSTLPKTVEKEKPLVPASGNAAQTTMPQTDEKEQHPVPAPGNTVHTTLVFDKGLQSRYKRETVEISGNVVRATHGETRKEVLGSGDAGKPLQRFSLSQKPLTYTPASTPSGSASSLSVYVNGIRWREVARLTDLADLGPGDRVFVVQTDEEQKTTIIFGDGKNGARLPTGTENVKAEYRAGIGNTGNVEAERVRLLMTRPLGVKAVDNPLRASGGADPENKSADLMRDNASLAVMAFDRVVSVQDYEDFARSSPGIGKARAELLRHGRQQFIHLTIAGIDDVPIDEESDRYKHLTAALRQYGDPHHQFSVATRQLLVPIISAQIVVLKDRQWDTLQQDVRKALLKRFSFPNCNLGQGAFLSEVITTIQNVRGVKYVDVDVFESIPQMQGEGRLRRPLTFPEIDREAQKVVEAKVKTGGRPRPRIPVSVAAIVKGEVRPAQLAYIPSVVPNAIVLTQRLT
ncbi:MAG: putative baseplate assembly protein [Nitrospira sp.]|nr:putative baseplate assembly protein [Nitrospira sp.]